eukprot:CAMPEP_0114501670 /NCGR_PEP_ID=MMETSP0109-20121206/8622_1 /TAXON_ID=29199 /ORGANISM="Chlorarachnion reptans, Strain CCCM449" /LENGTH=237 /DNA_ID=CAMNT_0001679415 /DNA_START=230 /DNA_END=942 /DNA_ORIENTATION=+
MPLLAKDGRTQNLRLKKKITRNSDILALASRKPGSSPVGGGVLNPAYWKLEYLKAEMYKMVPPRMKVLLLGSGAGRDAFYFPKEVQVTMEGLTVNIQDVIQGGGNALPALQIANSIKSLAADSFDVVVTAGEFSRVTNNGKMNSDQWFQSVYRVLRPNGRILFIEPAEAEFPRRFLQTFPAASVNSDQEALLGPLGSKFDYGEAVVFEDEFLELEPGAGFGKAATSPKDRDKKRRKR